MASTLRQQARSRVREAVAERKRAWEEREARLGETAVDVVTAIAARDRAEKAAADAIATMLADQVSLSEIGDRCGMPLREVTRLKRTYLEPAEPAPTRSDRTTEPRLS